MKTIFFLVLIWIVRLMCSEEYLDYIDQKTNDIKNNFNNKLKNNYPANNFNELISEKETLEKIFKKRGKDKSIVGKELIQIIDNKNTEYIFLIRSLIDEVIDASQFQEISNYFAKDTVLTIESYTRLRKNKGMIYFLIQKLLGVFNQYKKNINSIKLFLYFDFFLMTNDGIFYKKEEIEQMSSLLDGLFLNDYEVFFTSDKISSSQKILFLQHLFFEKEKYKEVVEVLTSKNIKASKFFKHFFLYSDFSFLVIKKFDQKKIIKSKEIQSFIDSLVESLGEEMKNHSEMEVILSYMHFLKNNDYFVDQASLIFKNKLQIIIQKYAIYIVNLRKNNQSSESFESLFSNSFHIFQSNLNIINISIDILFFFFNYFFLSYDFKIDFDTIKQNNIFEAILNDLNHDFFCRYVKNFELNSEDKKKIIHNLSVLLSENFNLLSKIKVLFNMNEVEIDSKKLNFISYADNSITNLEGENLESKERLKKREEWLKKIVGSVSIIDVGNYIDNFRNFDSIIEKQILWQLIQIHSEAIESLFLDIETFLFQEKLTHLFSKELFENFINDLDEKYFFNEKNEIITHFVEYGIFKLINSFDLPDEKSKQEVSRLLVSYIAEKYSLSSYSDFYFINKHFKDTYTLKKELLNRNKEEIILTENKKIEEVKIENEEVKKENNDYFGQCVSIINTHYLKKKFDKKLEQMNNNQNNENKDNKNKEFDENLEEMNNNQDLDQNNENKKVNCNLENEKSEDEKLDEEKNCSFSKQSVGTIFSKCEKIVLTDCFEKLKINSVSKNPQDNSCLLWENCNLEMLFENSDDDKNIIAVISDKKINWLVVGVSLSPLAISSILEVCGQVAKNNRNNGSKDLNFLRRMAGEITLYIDRIGNKTITGENNSILCHKKIFFGGCLLSAGLLITFYSKPSIHHTIKKSLRDLLKY